MQIIIPPRDREVPIISVGKQVHFLHILTAANALAAIATADTHIQGLLRRSSACRGAYSATTRDHRQLMRVSDDQGLSETFHMETAIDPRFGNSDSYRCTYLLTPFSGDAPG